MTVREVAAGSGRYTVARRDNHAPKAATSVEYVNGWVTSRPCGDAPTVGQAAERHLWNRCMDRRADRCEPAAWYAGDPNTPWAAVLDMLRRGFDDEALELARLLRWCQEQAPASADTIWSLTDVARGAHD